MQVRLKIGVFLKCLLLCILDLIPLIQNRRFHVLEGKVQRTAYKVETFCFPPQSGVDLRRDGAEQYLGFVSSHHTVWPADRKVEGEGRAGQALPAPGLGGPHPPTRYERKFKRQTGKRKAPREPFQTLPAVSPEWTNGCLVFSKTNRNSTWNLVSYSGFQRVLHSPLSKPFLEVKNHLGIWLFSQFHFVKEGKGHQAGLHTLAADNKNSDCILGEVKDKFMQCSHGNLLN